MNNPDAIINVMGIADGLVLILATFVGSSITEVMRVDAWFLRQASEKTRPLNLIFGILVAGYGIYSLIG